MIYTTSLQVVRQAYDKCKRVKKILQSHCVKYEERDLYKKKEYQQELQFRLNLSQVDLPHIFFNGKYIGNCDQIESFSDQGLLKKLFNDLEVSLLFVFLPNKERKKNEIFLFKSFFFIFIYLQNKKENKIKNFL